MSGPSVLCGSTGAGEVPLFYVVVQEQERFLFYVVVQEHEWSLCFMW